MYGSYIRAARERAGLTPAEAAARAGYSTPDMIYKIEKDKATPSLEGLDRLAEVYGMRIGDLLPNSGANPIVDRLEPVLAAMVGLREDQIDDLIRNLAEQARTLASWRRRDEAQGRLRPVPQEGNIETKLDRAYPPASARTNLETGHARAKDGRAARRATTKPEQQGEEG